MYTIALPHEEFSTWVDNQIKVRTPLTEDDPNYEGEQLFITTAHDAMQSTASPNEK